MFDKGGFPKEYFGDLETYQQTARSSDGRPTKFPIRFSHELIGRLNAVLADDRVQLCWLTSWRAQVAKPAKRMGLVSARPPVVIDYPETRDRSQAGKPAGLENFLRDVPPKARVVWVDDTRHSGPSYTHTQCVELCLQRAGQRFLPIGPDDRHGISRAEMARIESFTNLPANPKRRL